LLNGFGRRANSAQIRIAKINGEVADSVFRQQVITTIAQVLNEYWDYLSDQEQVGVAQQALAYSQKLLADNKRQVEIGTLAPIEITRAASEVASAKGALITSQTLALQQETLLKQLIFRNVMDQRIAEVSIVPTDKPDENMAVPDISLSAAVGEATTKRPDVKQAALDLDARKVVVKGTRNLLLPALTLSAEYSTQGLGGNECLTTTATCTMPCVTIPPPAGSMVVPGGLHDALAQVFQSNFPTYGVSLNLNLPLRNRIAQAANIQAQLAEKQSAANLQRLHNTVAVDVRNAQITLAQDKAAVDADIRARILAEQTLDAEQKKFLLGASTTFLVIQYESFVAQARSTEVAARNVYVKTRAALERATGAILEDNGIREEEALRGRLSH